MVKQGIDKRQEVLLLIAFHLAYGAMSGILDISMAVILGRTQANLVALFFGSALAGALGLAFGLMAWTLIFRRRREQLSLAGVLIVSLTIFVAIGILAIAIDLMFRLQQDSGVYLFLMLPSFFLVLMPLWLRFDIKRPKGFEYLERQPPGRR